MIICVYGAASEHIDSFYITEGERLGRELARRGHDLVYGGGATGLMGAVSRGVREGGRRVTGVVPSFFTNEEILNPFCDEMIRPATMRERKRIMEERADAFIVTPGGIGTYEEFYEILCATQLGQLNKPIALLNTLGFYDPTIRMLEYAIEKGFVHAECRVLYPAFSTPEEVLDYVENYQPIDLSSMKTIRKDNE